MTTTTDFERAMSRELDAFNEKRKRPYSRIRRPRKAAASPGVRGYTVKLAVRMKRLSTDTLFVHESKTISRVEARIEAEKAAYAAGWIIIGYLVSIEKNEAPA